MYTLRFLFLCSIFICQVSVFQSHLHNQISGCDGHLVSVSNVTMCSKGRCEAKLFTVFRLSISGGEQLCLTFTGYGNNGTSIKPIKFELTTTKSNLIYDADFIYKTGFLAAGQAYIYNHCLCNEDPLRPVYRACNPFTEWTHNLPVDKVAPIPSGCLDWKRPLLMGWSSPTLCFDSDLAYSVFQIPDPYIETEIVIKVSGEKTEMKTILWQANRPEVITIAGFKLTLTRAINPKRSFAERYLVTKSVNTQFMVSNDVNDRSSEDLGKPGWFKQYANGQKAISKFLSTGLWYDYHCKGPHGIGDCCQIRSLWATTVDEWRWLNNVKKLDSGAWSWRPNVYSYLNDSEININNNLVGYEGQLVTKLNEHIDISGEFVGGVGVVYDYSHPSPIFIGNIILINETGYGYISMVIKNQVPIQGQIGIFANCSRIPYFSHYLVDESVKLTYRLIDRRDNMLCEVSVQAGESKDTRLIFIRGALGTEVPDRERNGTDRGDTTPPSSLGSLWSWLASLFKNGTLSTIITIIIIVVIVVIIIAGIIIFVILCIYAIPYLIPLFRGIATAVNVVRMKEKLK